MTMMMGGATVTVSPQSALQASPRCIPLPSSSAVIPSLNRVSRLVHAVGSSSRPRILCNSSSTPGGPGPGGKDSSQILDAFFLGKAVAEALTERIESTVGEFLSTIGRLQAEQQKQVQEFQDEVLEKAKRSKEKAAKEAMEEQSMDNPSPIVGSQSVYNDDIIQVEEAVGGQETLSGVSTDQICHE